MVRTRSLLLLIGLLAATGMACADPAAAQVLPAPAASSNAQPDDLSRGLPPAAVDSLLARLSDREIRELLRAELIRRAEEQAVPVEVMGVDTITALRQRFDAMLVTVAQRLQDWGMAIVSLDRQWPIVAERLALARYGFMAMLASVIALVSAGLATAKLIDHILRPARTVLSQPGKPAGYWSRVGRTLVLGALETLPVFGFIAATRAAGGLLIQPLGPLDGMIWIYHSGVSAGWLFLIAARRAFAPDTPDIRIARLDTSDAEALYRLLRKATMIGVSGWMLGGLFPNLGFGFPPAFATVALSGTLVALLLLKAIWNNRLHIAARTQDFLSTGQRHEQIDLIAHAAPVLLVVYLVVAWLYWLAHWIEDAQHELAGPLGGIIALLVLPVADRLGIELARAAVRQDTERGKNLRAVLIGTWRSLLGVLIVYGILRLWGLDLLLVAKGPGAPVWISTGFDIAITLLLGYLAWSLILAALRREDLGVAQTDDPEESAAEASRLDTLRPLLRSILLVVIAVVVTMIVLSSIGVDIGPLLASAGIVGIAVGFGAQTLVRDVFSGVVFLIDDAFRIGEYIELDQEVRGTVEWISFRSLILRHHRGPIITIPFGELKRVTNHNRDWVIYKMSFRFEPETDPEKLRKIVKRVGQEFLEHPEHGPKFIEPLKSQGVQTIDDDSALVIRVKFKCYPNTQFVLRREIYHRLRQVFLDNGIHFARRKVEVVGANAGSPAAASVEEAFGQAPPA